MYVTKHQCDVGWLKSSVEMRVTCNYVVEREQSGRRWVDSSSCGSFKGCILPCAIVKLAIGHSFVLLNPFFSCTDT